MTKYIFIQDGKINGCGECKQLTVGVENLEVSEDLYNSFVQDVDKYTYTNGEIVENPEYETIKATRKINLRIDEIITELKELDEKRIRAVCEDEIKDEKTNETWLEYYNSLVYELRIELNSLKSQL